MPESIFVIDFHLIEYHLNQDMDDIEEKKPDTASNQKNEEGESLIDYLGPAVLFLVNLIILIFCIIKGTYLLSAIPVLGLIIAISILLKK